mmetsp:Transcript_10638/g.22004  ORF Transcript_10638/g.22004 Transcript_10638/m.22004 type:complete len:548 (-) Transcript_10638:32-1675(-)
MNDVHVGLEDRAKVPLLGGDSDGQGAEDAGDLDPVARLDRVDVIVEDVVGHGRRRLALWHSVWRLLHGDLLLVGEEAAVVQEHHRVEGVAHGALLRLLDVAAVDVDWLRRVPAHRALEGRLLQIGENRRHARHHALDRHQVVHIGWVQPAHRLHVPQVEGAHLEAEHEAVLVLQAGLAVLLALRVLLPERSILLHNARRDLVHHDVEKGHDLLRVGNQLRVELLVVGVQVAAVEVDAVLAALDHIQDEVGVLWPAGVVLGGALRGRVGRKGGRVDEVPDGRARLDAVEVGDEAPEAALRLGDVHVRAPHEGCLRVLEEHLVLVAEERAAGDGGRAQERAVAAAAVAVVVVDVRGVAEGRARGREAWGEAAAVVPPLRLAAPAEEDGRGGARVERAHVAAQRGAARRALPAAVAELRARRQRHSGEVHRPGHAPRPRVRERAPPLPPHAHARRRVQVRGGQRPAVVPGHWGRGVGADRRRVQRAALRGPAAGPRRAVRRLLLLDGRARRVRPRGRAREALAPAPVLLRHRCLLLLRSIPIGTALASSE